MKIDKDTLDAHNRAKLEKSVIRNLVRSTVLGELTGIKIDIEDGEKYTCVQIEEKISNALKPLEEKFQYFGERIEMFKKTAFGKKPSKVIVDDILLGYLIESYITQINEVFPHGN